MKKLWIEDIADLPAVAWSENSPSINFIDKTNDIVAWYKHGKSVLDLDRYRYESKAPFYTLAGTQLENWASLSGEVKKIGAEMFFIPYQLRLTVISEQEDYDNWEKIIEKTQGTPTEIYIGRAKTFDEMRRCVAHKVRKEELSMTASQQMLKDVGLMVDWFIRSNSPEFKQWLTNEAGTPYENDGFAQKSYYSLDLKNKLYDIYNGNY
jgi:hypothetical protein